MPDWIPLAAALLALAVAIWAELRSRHYADQAVAAMRVAEQHADRAQAATDRATAAVGLARGYIESKALREKLLEL